MDADKLPRDGNLFGFGEPLSHDVDGDRGARLAPKLPDGLDEVHVDGALVLDLDDGVFALDSRSVGGGPLQGGDDCEFAVSDTDDNPQPAERAVGAQAELLVDLGGQ